MRVNDALIGVLLVAFALAIGLYARTLPALPGQEYGAAVFPILIAFGLGGCGLLLILGGARNWEGAIQGADWMRSRGAWFRLLLTVGLLLFYILAASSLGFVPVALIILTALCWALGTRWWQAILVAVVVTFLIHEGFDRLLLVPLPRGSLWS